ncbi:MAG: response regulator [Lachnospiraceae bacterium]|nr:response regulator [Lachnospiraceae bacterium]
MYKIMLADDEGIVIDSLKFIIEKEFGDSCIVESAKTGRSVIELAERFRPDIAIMDIQMPGINGIDAMKEIRSFSKGIIFIVMSAYDKFDYAQEAINLGVLEYITKPMNRDRITRVLKRAMGMIDEERTKRSNDLLIKEKLETVVPIIENGLIYNILFQEHFEEDVENFKSLLGIEEEFGYMIAFVFGDEQQGNHMTNAVGTSVRVQSHYQEVREMAREYFPGVMGSVMANKIAMLVPCREQKMEYNERIELIDRARELVRKMRKRLNVSFRIGIGSIKGLKNQLESYNEALNALVNSTGTVAHVDDLPLSCDYEDNYPIDLEKQLFDAVSKGDSNMTREKAARFFGWMAETYPDSLMDIRLKVLEFVLWAEHLAYENGGMSYQFKVREDWLPLLMQMSELGELESWFLDKMTAASRNVATKREEKSVSLVEKIKTYINENFQRDLSLDEISREYDISPYYFSKIFKDETGENFIEYLTAVRMDKAKQLLLNKELSMKEICSMVGYADPNYFSRSFKKNVGVTPTEYREGKG